MLHFSMKTYVSSFVENEFKPLILILPFMTFELE